MKCNSCKPSAKVVSTINVPELMPMLLCCLIRTHYLLVSLLYCCCFSSDSTLDYLGSRTVWIRPCVPLTQLVELNFRKLLDLTLTKVVIGYITLDLYIKSFVKNKEFLAFITSILTK